MSELKPCPFCGGQAEISQYGTGRQITQYSCTDCGASLETGETFNHGARWNHREQLTVNLPSQQKYLAYDDTYISGEKAGHNKLLAVVVERLEAVGVKVVLDDQ